MSNLMTPSTPKRHPFAIKNLYTGEMSPLKCNMIFQTFPGIQVNQDASQIFISRSGIGLIIVQEGA